MQKRSCFYLLSYMFSEAKYNTIYEPLVYISKSTTGFLSLAFDDSAENVWIAAMGIPSTDLEKIVNFAKATIHESLDMPVHINAVLVDPADKPKQTKEISYSQSQKNMMSNIEDSYILIFKTLKEAEKYFQENQNQTQTDITHLPEATSYYKTIVNYLNSKRWDIDE